MKYTAEQYSIIALNLLVEMSTHRYKNLISHFDTAENVLNANSKEIGTVTDIPQSLAHKIALLKTDGQIDREIELAQKLGVCIYTCVDKNYPDSLRILRDYPLVVYVKGKIKELDIFSLGIVGTRHPTNYGLQAVSYFSRELAKKEITIVSGLARGIDTEAHKSTLNVEGRTIAVLGNGLNRHYPPENKKLEDKIFQNGALVSEFPLNTIPDKINFPRRNRIIAGLSLGTLVVEADIKSGALITAKYALDQGKDVFAVPGSIFSKYSNGTHYLIKSGAQLVTSSEEITDAIMPLSEWIKKRSKKKIEKDDGLNLKNKLEEKVIEIISQKIDGVSIEYLSNNSGLSRSELATTLLNLELRGFIKTLPGKIYIVN